MNDNIFLEINNIFSFANGPYTVTCIREILRSKKIIIPEYEVNNHLLELQSKGIVNFNNGFWSNAKANHSIPASVSSDSWSPSKSKLLLSLPIIDYPLTQKSSQNEIPEITLKSEASNWGLFRRLLKYYIDCVANDSGCEAHSFSDKFNEDFIFLNLKGKWYPEANISWILFLFINSPDFFKKLSKIGNDFSLILGYPTQFWDISKDASVKSSIIKPIFTYKIDFEFKPGGLEISCENPFPEINLDWLESTFKSSEQQKHFLSACGMIGNAEENSFDGTKNLFPDFPDFKKLAFAAQNFLKVKEVLNPDFITADVELDKISNGIYNKAVLMIASRSNYSKNLLKELSEICDAPDETLDNTALKHVFKLNTVACPKTNVSLNSVSSIINTTELNIEQVKSIDALLNDDVIVITGPPGTGKSQVVSAAIENFRLKDRPILFASRNHKAIDAVLNKVDNAYIVRCNSKDDPSLKRDFIKALDEILSQTFKQEAFDEWTFIERKLNDKVDFRDKLLSDLRQINEYGESISKLQYFSESLIEKISACDLKNISIDDANLNTIKDNVDLLAKIFQSFNLNEGSSIINKIFVCFKSMFYVGKMQKANTALNKHLKKSFLSLNILKFSNVIANHQIILELLNALSYLKMQNQISDLSNKLKCLPFKDELTEKLSHVIKEIIGLSCEALGKDLERRQGINDPNSRELLSNLKSALKGLINPVIGKDVQQGIMMTLKNNTTKLLYHFPAWAVTNLSIGSRIPLLPAIFDLAIVDEASQCDIASVIPILFRAKRIAAVGDPKQLNQTTQISRSKDTMLKKRNNIIKLEEQRFSYPDNSFYDLIASDNKINPMMLKDHYRCEETIAAYCNDSFYRGELRILTDSSKLKIPASYKKGIFWNETESKINHGGSSGCYSPEECNIVIEITKKILYENSFEGTVGIVTPFRQQATRINDIIQTDIAYEKRALAELKVDTAHGFQGDERDVIILSLCAGSDMPSGSLHFLRDTSNLLNVAVSRARAVLIIVGNKKWATNCRIPHIERLTAEYKHVREFTEKDSPWYPHQSPWEKKLYDELLKKGIKTIPQYETRGRYLDLAYVNGAKKIDIEIDGEAYHRTSSGKRKIDDYLRDVILYSDNWKILRFWVYQLKEDIDKCITKILKSIE